MVWVIVVAALVVLTLGAWAGTGRLGEMPPVVDDRPKGRIPSGPIDADLLRELRIPTAVTGYSPAQVDLYLDSFAAAGGASPEGLEAVFDVVRGGYDMQVVDDLLERTSMTFGPSSEPASPAPETAAEQAPEPPSGAG